MKKVLILYKFLPQYRLDFFEKLKQELLHDNIQLDLIYGKLKNSGALKKDEVEISWGKFIANKSLSLGNKEFIWQPCLKYLKNKDLIIVEQANKLLINYYLMIARHFSGYKFAFWGHGRNLQDKFSSLQNRFKYVYLRNCDWWFAYTTGVKTFLVDHQFPEGKISVVQNAIDTATLIRQYSEIDTQQIIDLKRQLGIEGNRTAIYCGGMYPEKRLDFILEVIKRVKAEISDFHMIFLGSGIEAFKVEEASGKNPWIHYVGPKFGKDRIKYFKISSFQLMPGLVGLGILDSFALETPIITTTYPFHSPEIEYLENNVNGIMTEDNVNDYAQKVISLLLSGNYDHLIKGCRQSASKYTVEAMVHNFKEGIIKCLAS